MEKFEQNGFRLTCEGRERTMVAVKCYACLAQSKEEHEAFSPIAPDSYWSHGSERLLTISKLSMLGKMHSNF